MTIEEAIKNFKDLIDNAILENGTEGKHSIIRSSRPILNIHEAVKSELVNCGISAELIFPPIGERSPEMKLSGSLKQKDQDICAAPNIEKTPEVIDDGLLQGVTDPYGYEFTSKTLCINIRSQISSINKNFDTLYERTIAEAQNLHDRCPKMVLGEVYMIGIPELDDKEVLDKKISYKSIQSRLVEKYIKSFQAVNSRKVIDKNFFQYERVCLLIVDFSKEIPTIYNSVEELKEQGLLDMLSEVSMEGLTWSDFASDITSIYNERDRLGILS